MLIQNADHSANTVALPGGRQYDSLGAGVFDLPDQDAAALLPFPQWHTFGGDPASLLPGLLEPVTTDAEREQWEREAAELVATEPPAEPEKPQTRPQNRNRRTQRGPKS